MLTVLHYAADAMWIIAMALIASTSRGALKRVPAEVKMPMWGGVRLLRNTALGIMFGAPLLIAQGVARLNVAPELVTAHLDEQVLSDAAIRQRIDWALAALGARGAGPGTPIGPRPAAPAELPAAAPSVPTPSSPSVTLAPSSRRSR